jgi:hypothetical protein
MAVLGGELHSKSVLDNVTAATDGPSPNTHDSLDSGSNDEPMTEITVLPALGPDLGVVAYTN